MRATWRAAALMPAVAAIALAGCAKKVAVLPDDPIDRAATCGVVAAALERQAAGAKGDLSAEAQGRIFHYPMLAASTGPSFDKERANAVFKRTPQLFDHVVNGTWRPLQPQCATAYPPAAIAAPVLPKTAFDAALQCYVLVDFMRKALGDQGGSYTEAATTYSVMSTRLDGTLSPMLAKIGLKSGPALQARRAEALAAAAKLGQPPAVIAACTKRFG